MDHNEFVGAVAQRSGMQPGRARTVTCATLKTLAERIEAGEARSLAAQLPTELREFLFTPRESAERFDLAEFIRRVSTRGEVDLDTAGGVARAVFATMRDAVTPSEFDDVVSQLPREFWDMTAAVTGRFEAQRGRR